eukprot:217069_1
MYCSLLASLRSNMPALLKISEHSSNNNHNCPHQSLVQHLTSYDRLIGLACFILSSVKCRSFVPFYPLDSSVLTLMNTLNINLRWCLRLDLFCGGIEHVAHGCTALLATVFRIITHLTN